MFLIISKLWCISCWILYLNSWKIIARYRSFLECRYCLQHWALLLSPHDNIYQPSWIIIVSSWVIIILSWVILVSSEVVIVSLRVIVSSFSLVATSSSSQFGFKCEQFSLPSSHISYCLVYEGRYLYYTGFIRLY